MRRISPYTQPVQNVEPVEVSGSVDVSSPVRISDAVGAVAHLLHHGLVISDYVHDQTHHGNAWRLAYRWDALASGATAGLLLQTPQEIELDLTWDAAATGLCTIDLLEQPTITALGTPLWGGGVFRNKNRQVGVEPEAAHIYPPGMGAYIDPTVTSSGRFLVQQVMGGTAWKATTPGEDAGIPWITLNGMSYYLRIINTTQDAIYVAARILCVLYEE